MIEKAMSPRALDRWAAGLAAGLKTRPRRKSLGGDYMGTDLECWSTTGAAFEEFKREHLEALPAPWRDCCAALWKLPIFEMHSAALAVAARHAGDYRKSDWTLFRSWLDDSVGWAMIDGLCWNTFAIMVETYPDLAGKTDAWTRSPNLWARRASLVTFARPLRETGNFAAVALTHCAALLDDRDPMIVKAVSWVLREGIRHHRPQVEKFLSVHEAKLPRPVLREVRSKLVTGRKTGPAKPVRASRSKP